MKMEDITFKLLTIQTTTGGRVNKIITVDSKRSIIQIRNKDTICLSRATIAVGLAVNNRETLQDMFRNNLTEDDLKQINKTKQTKSPKMKVYYLIMKRNT